MRRSLRVTEEELAYRVEWEGNVRTSMGRIIGILRSAQRLGFRPRLPSRRPAERWLLAPPERHWIGHRRAGSVLQEAGLDGEADHQDWLTLQNAILGHLVGPGAC